MVKALIVRRMPDNEKIADFRICTKEVHRKNFEGKIFESARKKCIGKNFEEKIFESARKKCIGKTLQE